jgi:GT2 family glycosyltransferase
MIKTSIIIPTLNHLEDCLKPCIESIKKYVNLDDKEIIIAANGCIDSTKEYVESLGEPFKLLWFDKPMGFAVPNNEAVKMAQGEYILFLNNDAFLTGDVTKLLLAEFEKNHKLGIAGAQMRHNMETDRDFVIFYCAMMKKELFEKFGMFDEVFADGTCEDVDLCIKVSNAGYDLISITLPVIHKGGTTIVQMSNMMEKLNRNALILGKKWNSKWYRDLMEKQNHGIKVSIVIGTLNHLEDCLKPCCEAIQKYCNLEDKEVIIVANGCTDGTRAYVQSLGRPFKLLWYDDALGYSKANNEGIKIARGEYVLLLNSDAFFLEQTKDTAIDMLLEPFEKNPKVGIAGPTLSVSPSIQRAFIIFFCAMIKKEVFDKIGLLDEAFGKGAGEDTDFCVKAVAAGYELAVAGRMDSRGPEGIIGSVPIWHRGEATVHDFSDWDDHFENNTKLLVARYPIRNKVRNVEVVNEAKQVLCAIPTKGRYFTTLPLAIASVLSQTVKPDKLVIYDDGEHKDLREFPTYQYFFKNLDAVGIKWEVSFTPGIGQHHAHQKANTSDDYKFVWRLDDDTIAEPNVLEKLLSHMKDDVGAVAGSVVTPGGEAKEQAFGIKLLDVNRLPNIQWARGEGLYEVEHLYSSFLYRTNIVDYCMELSHVAHREETIFTHRLFRARYKLLVDRSAVTWHYRNPEGGIRTQKDPAPWQHDEEIFRKELAKWGYKFVALSHGLGDHLCFSNIIPELLKRCEKLVLFCVFGEAFEGINNVIVRPLQEAASFGCKEAGIYEYMTKYNWKRSMLKAYEKLYLD